MLPNIKNAVKQTAVYSLGNLSTKLVGLILLPLYTDRLSVSEYGTLGMLEVSTLFLVQILQFRLYAAYQRWFYDHPGKQKSILFTALVSLLGINAITFVFLFSFSENLSVLLFSKADHVYVIRLMLGVCVFQIMNSFPIALMRMQERSVFYVVVNLVKLVVTLVLTIMLVGYYDRGIAGIFEGQLAGYCIYFVLISGYMAGNIRFRLEIGIVKDMFRYSLPLMIGSVSSVIFSTVDRYALNYLVKTDALKMVGLYSLGYKIANIVKLIIIDAFKMALPAVVYKALNREHNRRFYSKILKYFAFVLVFCITGLVVFGREIIKVLSVNPDYWKAYSIVPIVSFGLIFFGLRGVTNMGLAIAKRTRIIAIIMIFMAIIKVILNILLIPLFYANGAALATMISEMIFFTVIYRYAQKHYYIPYELKKILLMILTAACIMAAAILIGDIPLAIRLVLKLLIFLSFPFFLYFLGFYEKVELDRIRGFWLKWKNPSNWKRK